MTSFRSTKHRTVTPYKKGRRHYGWFVKLTASGEEIYLARRRITDIFRSGEKTISDAVRAGTAAWAIDEEDLIRIRARGIKGVGVRLEPTGDIYLAHIDWFFDRDRARVMNYERRGGALQRYLPLSEFRLRPGRVRV